MARWPRRCVGSTLRWRCSRGLVAVLALYRAGSFIHELTHIKQGALPASSWSWNLLVGVPLLVPSFMYEGVHNQHHAKTYYGTAEDPEYLPLALMKPWTLPVFLVAAALAPIGMLIRFAVLAPLSLLSPKLRETWSSSAIPGCRSIRASAASRAEGEFARDWRWQEARGQRLGDRADRAWSRPAIIPLRAFLIFLGVASGVMFLNQVRTLVAHLWENDGEPMSVTEQYLDSVNVPPPATLPALWAPVGPALPRAAPSAAGPALSRAGRGASPARGDARRGFALSRRQLRGLSPLVARLAVSQLARRRRADLFFLPDQARLRRSAGTGGTAPRRRATAGRRRNCPAPG